MRQITTEDQPRMRQWAIDILKIPLPNDAEFLGQLVDDELKAVVVFCDFRARSCNLHIAAIGSNWMSKKLLWFTFYYAFVKREVKVIIGVISGANEKALKLDRHLGFEEVVRIADAHEDGDLVIMTMRPHQCRWLSLGEKYGC